MYVCLRGCMCTVHSSTHCVSVYSTNCGCSRYVEADRRAVAKCRSRAYKMGCTMYICTRYKYEVLLHTLYLVPRKSIHADIVRGTMYKYTRYVVPRTSYEVHTCIHKSGAEKNTLLRTHRESFFFKKRLSVRARMVRGCLHSSTYGGIRVIVNPKKRLSGGGEGEVRCTSFRYRLASVAYLTFAPQKKMQRIQYQSGFKPLALPRLAGDRSQCALKKPPSPFGPKFAQFVVHIA